VSRQAIAAALARQDLSSGERLVAFSLASFANRRHRAWPSALVAAARAGLGKSQYLRAREQLVRRGLVVVEEPASGRGRSTTLVLEFADTGPWWDGEINAELLEAVLSYSTARGPARLLLAAMAALAGSDGIVAGLTTEQLCRAAGVADRTYRWAREALIASGELTLLCGVGGRGNVNRWEVAIPRDRAGGARPDTIARRVVPAAGARPLVAAAKRDGREFADAAGKVGHDRTLPAQNGPILAGVYGRKGGHDGTFSPTNRPVGIGASAVKGGQGRTLFDPVALETPAQTPAAHARAGREPQNPGTRDHPPQTPL
jgi:hypothetical protein